MSDEAAIREYLKRVEERLAERGHEIVMEEFRKVGGVSLSKSESLILQAGIHAGIAGSFFWMGEQELFDAKAMARAVTEGKLP